MTREFRLVRAEKCPTSSMGGGSLALLLEPRCSKFSGELTSLQAVCSLELEYLGIQPSPTWGVSPFILQGGAPYLHIYIVMSWSAWGSFVFVSRRVPPGRSGVERLCQVGFLGRRVVKLLSHLGQSEWLRYSVGARRSSSLLSVRIGTARPSLRGF